MFHFDYFIIMPFVRDTRTAFVEREYFLCINFSQKLSYRNIMDYRTTSAAIFSSNNVNLSVKSSCTGTRSSVILWAWWRHQMETFSAVPALCEGNSPVTGEFPSQRPVMRSFDVLFDMRLNKRLSKRSSRHWFETPSRSLWRTKSVSLVGAKSVRSDIRLAFQANVAALGST